MAWPFAQAVGTVPLGCGHDQNSPDDICVLQLSFAVFTPPSVPFILALYLLVTAVLARQCGFHLESVLTISLEIRLVSLACQYIYCLAIGHLLLPRFYYPFLFFLPYRSHRIYPTVPFDI